MERLYTIPLIVSIFILPFALVWGGVIPVDLRRWIYAAVGAGAVVVLLRSGWSLRDLGFRWDNARVAVVPYAAFAFFGAIGIVAVAVGAGRVPRDAWWLAPHFAYGLIVPVSAAQELFFRGMLMPLLGRIHRARGFLIVANAAIFAFLHVIFPDPAFVLPLSFIGGAIFAWLWLRWPSIWLASAAHIVLNAVFVLFCFGGFETSCVV